MKMYFLLFWVEMSCKKII